MPPGWFSFVPSRPAESIGWAELDSLESFLEPESLDWAAVEGLRVRASVDWAVLVEVEELPGLESVDSVEPVP